MYEPVLISDRDGNIFYQAGLFPMEAEAQKVLGIWRAKGADRRDGDQFVPLYETAEEWIAGR